MLIRCIKYVDIHGLEIDNSLWIEKGKDYLVLAMSVIFFPDKGDTKISYYIQASGKGDYLPHWARGEQFEIVEHSVYSEWELNMRNNKGILTFKLYPRIWNENSEWFIDELADDETPRAVALFCQERDKMIAEIKNIDDYFPE